MTKDERGKETSDPPHPSPSSLAPPRHLAFFADDTAHHDLCQGVPHPRLSSISLDAHTEAALEPYLAGLECVSEYASGTHVRVNSEQTLCSDLEQLLPDNARNPVSQTLERIELMYGS
ncbi:hypothetical protein F4775DRAFT_592363 [Biscogniauxia sp. FL1348]|nr:hypothetical protein F4775DRAFT_592363 [Biscogniauxia sp. FL1348]